MQQALLGRDQRAGAVDGDRPAFEHHRHGADLFAVRLGVAAGDCGVGVERRELATPSVERPVEGDAAVAVDDVDRAGIAEPRVVDRQLDDLDSPTARLLDPLAGADGGDHRHRLVAGDRGGDEGVGGLGVGEQFAVERLARRPAHHRAFVRRELPRHAQHGVRVLFGRPG
jgi:hypothetical protein